MTGNEFGLVMIGQGEAHVVYEGEHTRLRYVVAEAFSARAGERQREGRPDKAGLCRYIASQLTSGGAPSKRVKGKAASDIAVVRDRLVDGVSLSGV